MLKKQIMQLISQADSNDKLELHKEELEYVKKHNLLLEAGSITQKEANSRFLGAYIERSDKETEELIAEGGASFLTTPIQHLMKHLNEFIYIESEWFDVIGVDALSLEVDDVFRKYDVMLGLKLQKKYGQTIKEQLNQLLNGDESTYDLMFSQEDGLWSFNFDLNSLEGFSEEMSLNDTLVLIYSFLFTLMERVEETK